MCLFREERRGGDLIKDVVRGTVVMVVSGSRKDWMERGDLLAAVTERNQGWL